jgi:hypothetical protein
MTMTLPMPRIDETRESLGSAQDVMSRSEPATRDQLEAIERRAAVHAVVEAIESDTDLVPIHHRGRVIWARPINTARFVRAMAPHVCFN